MSLQQPDIEAGYFSLPEQEIFLRIEERKKELAGRLLILCHHYQQESLFRFADLKGDSLKLAREAASVHDREFIIFCGVHFMAESADILARPHQKVMLPHLHAGCPMADMATVGAVSMAYRDLVQAGVVQDELSVVPVTYVNSSAAVKAFVGEREGSVCTSSNAERVLAWALAKGDKVFFFPDEHLGRNSALALGIPAEEVLVWHRGELLGGSSVEQLRRARILLWDGYCEVHMRFLPDHVRRWRLLEPDIKIIVHPECASNVVQIADRYGSTEAIIEAVKKSPAGSKWAIGTEINLVERLQRQHPDKEIHLLAPSSCHCSTMARNQPVNLLWLLDNLAAGTVVNQIRVAPDVAIPARKSLEQMLYI
ncbi:MAG: quinolinate synthase NadA [Proteobacteria bacterium]|jgi:quinolinate synthase|nr:quinolinate synthase NadA [Desulfocapsa sp.]MBU3943768.1 quinolinate synthase NadA [Pseudomonadota bacterium]MCG2742658.1 quinolinate synthase NadA [Desulfobacteraceae bacterium]MBU4029111.1 quinolinate synthase NadA [Pseudomonadota bacterium]MBU4041798.1 quinolinate synthase NadA [Pseudomonadota bacterium]